LAWVAWWNTEVLCPPEDSRPSSISCGGRESNSQPSSRKSNALTTTTEPLSIFLSVFKLLQGLVIATCLRESAWRQCSALSPRSPVVDEECMRPVNDFPCLGSLLRVFCSASAEYILLVVWQEGHPAHENVPLISSLTQIHLENIPRDRYGAGGFCWYYMKVRLTAGPRRAHMIRSRSLRRRVWMTLMGQHHGHIIALISSRVVACHAVLTTATMTSRTGMNLSGR